jgi:hypothetical protein
MTKDEDDLDGGLPFNPIKRPKADGRELRLRASVFIRQVCILYFFLQIIRV